MSFARVVGYLKNIIDTNFKEAEALTQYRKNLAKILNRTDKYLKNKDPGFYSLVKDSLSSLHSLLIQPINATEFEKWQQQTFNCLLEFIKLNLRIIANCNFYNVLLKSINSKQESNNKAIKQWVSNCLGHLFSIKKSADREAMLDALTKIASNQLAALTYTPILGFESAITDTNTRDKLRQRCLHNTAMDIRFGIKFAQMLGFIKPVAKNTTDLLTKMQEKSPLLKIYSDEEAAVTAVVTGNYSSQAASQKDQKEKPVLTLARTIFSTFKEGPYYLHNSTAVFLKENLEAVSLKKYSNKIKQIQTDEIGKSITAITNKWLESAARVFQQTNYWWPRTWISNHSDQFARNQGQAILILNHTSPPKQGELINTDLIKILTKVYKETHFTSYGLKALSLNTINNIVQLLCTKITIPGSLNTLAGVFKHMVSKRMPSNTPLFDYAYKVILDSFDHLTTNKKIEFVYTLIKHERLTGKFNPALKKLIESTILSVIKDETATDKKIQRLIEKIEQRKKKVASGIQVFKVLSKRERKMESNLATNGLTAILINREIRRQRIKAEEILHNSLNKLWKRNNLPSCKKIQSTLKLLQITLQYRSSNLSDQQKIEWLNQTLKKLAETSTLTKLERTELAIQTLAILYQYSTLNDQQKKELAKDKLHIVDEVFQSDAAQKNALIQKMASILLTYSNLEEQEILTLTQDFSSEVAILPISENIDAQNPELASSSHSNSINNESFVDQTRIENLAHEIGENTSGIKKQHFYHQLQQRLKAHIQKENINIITSQPSLITDLLVGIIKLLNNHPMKEYRLIMLTLNSIENLANYIAYKLAIILQNTPLDTNSPDVFVNDCLEKLIKIKPHSKAPILKTENKSTTTPAAVLNNITLNAGQAADSHVLLASYSAFPTAFTQTLFVRKQKETVAVPPSYSSQLAPPLSGNEYTANIGLNLLVNGYSMPPRNQNDYRSGKKLKNFIVVRKKPSGIEPGFLGFIRNQAFSDAVEEVINAILENSNDEYFKKFNEHHTNDSDRKEGANFRQHFLDNDDCREVIFARIQEQKLVSLYLIKQDYKDPEPGKEKVTVEADGVNGTRTMEQALSLVEGAPHLQGPMRALVLWGYRVVRRKSRTEENCNAILECLSTAVAGVFMNTQKQKLIQGEYSGQGLLKFMTCSEWIEGFSDFEHQVISNGVTGFLVARDENGKKLPPSGQCYISDNSINNLGQQLIFPLLSYDYDSLGSRGQNKGRVGNEFFGIDFGHSFRERNQIIGLLQDDFSLIKQAPTVIKNISIFSDTMLSEKMQGVLLLYKLRTQTEKLPANIQSIVDSYGAEFAEKFANTHYGQDVAIFDYYEKLFSEKTLKDSSRAEEYRLYKGKVTNAKDYYLESANILLEKFKSRILLTAQQLDFLDNLEKLCSDTTNKHLFKSGEHKGKSVHFNHLQKCVTKRPRVEFQLDYQEGSWLSIRMISENSQQAIETIKKFLEEMQESSLDAAHLFLCFRHDKNGDIIFNIYKSDFEKYCEIFSEDKIAAFKGQPLVVQPDIAIDKEEEVRSSYRMSL